MNEAQLQHKLTIYSRTEESINESIRNNRDALQHIRNLISETKQFLEEFKEQPKKMPSPESVREGLDKKDADAD